MVWTALQVADTTAAAGALSWDFEKEAVYATGILSHSLTQLVVVDEQIATTVTMAAAATTHIHLRSLASFSLLLIFLLQITPVRITSLPPSTLFKVFFDSSMQRPLLQDVAGSVLSLVPGTFREGREANFCFGVGSSRCVEVRSRRKRSITKCCETTRWGVGVRWVLFVSFRALCLLLYSSSLHLLPSSICTLICTASLPRVSYLMLLLLLLPLFHFYFPSCIASSRCRYPFGCWSQSRFQYRMALSLPPPT